MKRLRKSNNRVFSGVCAGISEYIDPEWDPIFIRIAFSILTVFNPLILVVYIVLAIVLPGPEYQY
jgi:phage shock protein C